MKEPETFLEAVAYFTDLDRANEYIARIRWPYGVACPREGCGSADVRESKTVIEKPASRLKPARKIVRHLWFCKDCKRQFTAKVGTIFEDSPIGLDKWLPAMWLLGSCRNGVSSYEIARDLGITQKTAWFMLHRIRAAMGTRTFTEKMRGPVQADEAYIGRRPRPSNRQSRTFAKPLEKAGILALVAPERREARTFPISDATVATLSGTVRKHVEPGETVYTDGHISYRPLKQWFEHYTVDHFQEYVRGPVTTNAVEMFWSLLKRAINGTYIGVSPKHLVAYCDEQAFRYNMVGHGDEQRLAKVAKGADGRRLTYADLTGRGATRLRGKRSPGRPRLRR